MTRTRALFSRAFWLDAIERAVKTFAQSAVSLLTASGVLNLFAADWGDVAAVGGLAALVSVLTSVASIPAPGVSPASLVPPGA